MHTILNHGKISSFCGEVIFGWHSVCNMKDLWSPHRGYIISPTNVWRCLVYNLNAVMHRTAAKNSDLAAGDSFLKFDLNKSDTIELKIDQMNNQIRHLEKSIGELQAKVKAYHDIILRYESAFREEISLYKLQRCKLATLQAAFLHQQNFAREIEQQINSYLNETSPHQQSAHSTFRRIILRFFHQSKLNQNTTSLKISEIERIIHQKQQLLERFQADVRNCNGDSVGMSAPDRQPLALN